MDACEPPHRDGTVIKEETGRHLDHLDGWRGVAVLLVVFGHFWGDAHIWNGISSSGVDLFFVLSGRLMAEILFIRRSDLPTFFVRRFSRIYPALATFVIVTTLAFHGTAFSHGAVAAVVALTMTLNYAMVYTHPIAMLDHLWSLCVEEHAYILLAGIALCSRRRSFHFGAAIALLGLAALVNGVVRTELLGHAMLETRWRTDVSVAGIFIAAALWLRFKSVSVRAWVSPVALVIAVLLRLQESTLLSFGLYTVAIAIAIVALDGAPAAIRRALSLPFIRKIGLWSYSIYLWQQPFYKLVHFGSWPPLPALGCAFACALISFYVVERPARKVINARFAAFLNRRATLSTAAG